MLIVIHFIAIMILGVYRAPQDNSPIAEWVTLSEMKFTLHYILRAVGIFLSLTTHGK